MRAVVFKNHHEPTTSIAYLVRKMVPGIEGGFTHDYRSDEPVPT
mgnify:CR=1 FL=1